MKPSPWSTGVPYDPSNVSITGGTISGITDLAVADGGTGASTAQAAAANLKVPYVLAQGAAVTSADNTDEQVLATITIPANAMGANGRVQITAIFSMTGSGNNKVMRVRYSGAAGSELHSTAIVTTSTVAKFIIDLVNRGATDSQMSHSILFHGTSGSNHTVNVRTATTTVDTTAATTIVITGQKATGSETLTLDAYSAVLVKP